VHWLSPTLLLALLASPAGAGAQLPGDTHLHRLAVQIGAPVPITVLGYRGDSKGFSQEFILAGSAEYEFRLTASPRLAVAILATTGWLFGTGSGTSGSLGLVLGGPAVTLGDDLWTAGALPGGLVGGLGSSVAWVHLHVDENVGMDVIAVGGRAFLRVEQAVSAICRLTATFAFDWLSAPLNRDSFFNQPLGQTRILWLLLGMAFDLGPTLDVDAAAP
jgi:hypothetical protein